MSSITLTECDYKKTRAQVRKLNKDLARLLKKRSIVFTKVEAVIDSFSLSPLGGPVSGPGSVSHLTIKLTFWRKS